VLHHAKSEGGFYLSRHIRRGVFNPSLFWSLLNNPVETGLYENRI